MKNITVVKRKDAGYKDIDILVDRAEGKERLGEGIIVGVKIDSFIDMQIHRDMGFIGYLIDGIIYVRFLEATIHGPENLFNIKGS